MGSILQEPGIYGSTRIDRLIFPHFRIHSFFKRRRQVAFEVWEGSGPTDDLCFRAQIIIGFSILPAARSFGSSTRYV